MELVRVMQLGYALILGVFFLMIWISLVESRETETVRYPPCYFNPLCSCSKAVPDLGIVKCQDIHLPRIPEHVNISKVFMLHMENNGLRTIEPFFLQSTGLYKIIISRNPLTLVTDEAFLGLERSLWELELSYCQITKVPNRSLRYLQKLRLLDLTGNEINKISPENWRGLESSLEVLVLAENSITHIPIDAFAGLPLLETIDLRGNNLRELDPSVFRDGMGKLAYLLLGNNQLSAIPYQALQPLRTLKTLDLSHNRVNKMSPATEPGIKINLNFQLNLDVLRIDYNQLKILEPLSFQYFNVLNKTYLDGNPISVIEDEAFRQAKIKELYLRGCGLTQISPTAFMGLENFLELLDLSGNNISLLPQDVFNRFQLIRILLLRDNILSKINPAELFNAFVLTLNTLDMSGTDNAPMSIQDLRRFRSLRALSLSRLPQPHIDLEDFLEFGIDLEELKINFAGIQSIKNNAFKYVHGLRSIDMADNSISTIENNAFVDIGHSLEYLSLSHALSSSISSVPVEALKVLTNLEHLDLSNNHLRTVQETSFHFLGKLRSLELQDNVIEVIPKGTFQSDYHANLEEIYLSFNNLKTISQHTFVHLPQLEQLHLDDNRIDKLERRSFMNLEHLKRLNLKGNKLSTVSYETFQNLPELEDLDMAYNSLINFDFSMFDQVGTLAMFHVNVSHNSLKELTLNMPPAFESDVGLGGLHSNVKVLDMSFNNISLIAKQFFKPAELSLTHLYLGHNRILNATRDVFGNMPHLQRLDLSWNQIYEMDFDMFRNTKKLQLLDVSNNRIADIPSDLFRFLNNLRIVNFSHNRLRALPDNLFREQGLERLDISHNMLSKLPLTSMSVATALSVCELDVSWNSISSLSHGGVLQRFKNLNWLDLSYNRLAQIDSNTFKGLPRLSSLDLSHNLQLALEPNGLSFQGVEYSLLHLNLANVSLNMVPILPTPNLVSLSLAHNSLPNVPPEMATNMTNLQKLYLDYNDLTSVPIVTHSLFELRYLSMVSNPVTYLSNTSLLGVADHLEELDIRNFDLNTLEAGAFCKMYSLRTLKINLYTDLKLFNIPTIIQWNSGLRNLEIHVNKATDSTLEKEMIGDLPPKLRNVTFSGRGLKKLGNNILQGTRSPELHLCFRNTSVMKISETFFRNLGRARNITLDVRYNPELKSLMNPSTGSKPDLFKKTFLMELDITGNKWDCDCDLGWIEVWQRKRRQYICDRSPSVTPSFNHFDYSCRHVDDDLRTAACANRNNQSVIEILKSEIECGWSSAMPLHTWQTSVAILLCLLLQFLI
ncbi:chaoptin isoform X2 [Cylas formicarius]|uniref:chaoptin isoform X1 n=1 Tax=Cylas formicarius TaxID=197179 RepID=UPI002958AAD6|nr:chaoptin isoform X1 [Cylas formicarius]XP_060524011.1 chaoptin isoform X2 [Cylas formicarius]